MENIFKSLRSNFEKYSFKEVEDQVEKLSEDELLFLLNKINSNINLINQFQNKKILKFRSFLKELFFRKGIKVCLFENIELIEELYKNILDDKNKINIVNEIFLIQNLFNYTREKYKGMRLLPQENIEGGFVLNELILKVANSDRNIETLCKIINYNLQSIAYSNSELVNNEDEIILPSEVLEKIKWEEALLAGSFLNTGMWDIVQDIDYNFKFFNNYITNSILNDRKEIYVKISGLHLYAMIAMQRMMTIHADILVNQYREYEKSLTEMSNTEKEFVFLRSLFYRLYFIDIEVDIDLYNGLTIKEWFLSFLSLQEISEVHGFSSVNFDEIIKFFRRNGVGGSKFIIAIKNLTYKRERRADLYDTPIIKISDGSYLIFPLSIQGANFERILNSIFSKSNLQITDKGQLFEKEVVSMLKNYKNFFNVREVEFNVKSDEKPQYQYDVILEWDDYVFIIECKNRSIATTESISLNQFEQKISEYIGQISRLEYGLVNYPQKHNINLKNKKIIKLILNSLPFSLDYPISGTYFVDYSVFLRFFSSREICLEEVFSESKVVNKKTVNILWTGNQPTVQDFIKYLEKPPQVLYLKSKVKNYETYHDLGGYKIKVDRFTWK